MTNDNTFKPKTVGLAISIAMCLGGCAENTTRPTIASSKLPDSQQKRYVTFSDLAVALEIAGSKAKYEDFAKALRADDSDIVVSKLQQKFGSDGFSTNNKTSTFDRKTHTRNMELSGGSNRLFLCVSMEKGENGWLATSHEFSDSLRGLEC